MRALDASTATAPRIDANVGIDSATDAVPDADAIGAVLDRLHWTVLEFRHRELRTATTVRDDVRGGIRFHYVASGALEAHRDGEPPLIMQAGDFVMMSDGGPARLLATNETLLLSGSLALNGADAIPASALPPVLFTCGFRVHEPIFASLLETMYRESSSDRAGSGTVIERLADVVASAAVRIWLERGCGNARDLLSPARDPYLSRALDAIHDDPGSPWTVESLARLARASRSQFAEQFKDVIGDTPARYVTRVRMERAERMLRAGASVTAVAFQLGYESDAGFSRAFRRHAGVAPSLWRRSVITAA
jgi:AraC-like DNA-binding protein